ncbi:MAG: DnaJ domain-containing protein [Proteobacteria bacterium]|nr:DnaJ domain-containing protein [Pseudomonadota bacterium]
MQALLFGLAALSFGLVVLRALTLVTPHTLAQRGKPAIGVLALAAAGLLLLRGLLPLALALVMVGLWLLAANNLRFPGSGGDAEDRKRSSTVRTEHVEMELDHDSGDMRGRVLKGFFAGRRLEDLSPVQLAHLWQDCRFVDAQAAQLVEAYLDRIHPTWRDDLARAEAGSPKGADGRMTLEEAFEILGLKPGASEADIKRAHRELMLRLHPDRGGSHYLAAKINEAKEVALGSRPA